MKRIMAVGTGLLAIVTACSKSSSDSTTTVDCGTATKSYSTDVSPILQSTCATSSSCHASGSSNGPGALTTYQQVYNARVDIRSSVANGSMPKNASLPTSQKNIILCWIDNGALNN